MRSNDEYDYEPSYEHVPNCYHVVIAIPRGNGGVLIQRLENGQFSLPMVSFDPAEISLTRKALQFLTNFGLTVEAKDLSELTGYLWQPKFEGSRLVSVDVFCGLLVEGATQKVVLNPHRTLQEVTLADVKSLPLVGLKVSEEPESSEVDARAQLLFDALSVAAGPFYQEPETWNRVDEIGHELSEDGFLPIFNGAYLGIYRESRYRYYYRLDPRQPERRHVGPLDQLVRS